MQNFKSKWRHPGRGPRGGLHGQASQKYVQPGNLDPNKPYAKRGALPAKWTCEELKKRVLHDDAEPVPADGNCRAGWHKIRLWANNKNDFHFYRQNQGKSWTHKTGEGLYKGCDLDFYNGYATVVIYV